MWNYNIIMKVKTLEDYKAAILNPRKKLFRNGAVVYNSIGTEDDEPIVGDGVWLEYWEAASGRAIPENCPCCNAPLDRDAGNIHGTHVQENGALLAVRYIEAFFEDRIKNRYSSESTKIDIITSK